MIKPSFDEIKTSTENAVSFVEWIAELLRSKNWVRKLLFFDIAIGVICNPALLPKWLAWVIDKPKLPGWHPPVFWLVFGLVFLAALIVAILTKPKKSVAPAIDFSKRSAIKGLRPFGFEDAELFARLQREQDLHDCLEAITEREFRFGILCGVSGSGKSSFLQAGLWPRLQQQKPAYRCIYVKFSDLDPLDSLRQEITKQFQLPKEKVEALDFLTLLESVVQAKPDPIVLLFDQFEQFFVNHKTKEEREPFVQALAAWYHRSQSLPIKILVCVRGDFSDRLIELQKAMGYSLGVHNYFRLEKFTPEQTVEVFRAIAEAEGIDFDQDFVKEIAEQELSSREDNLVSPVDIQILAWMIGGQKATMERAFNRVAYQKLGGVEGLIERFFVTGFTSA